MTVRTLPFPSHLVRWLMAPAALLAVLAAAATLLRRRMHQPSLPRMSDEWLHNLDRGYHDAWR
jgi:hypothetical protein